MLHCIVACKMLTSILIVMFYLPDTSVILYKHKQFSHKKILQTVMEKLITEILEITVGLLVFSANFYSR